MAEACPSLLPWLLDSFIPLASRLWYLNENTQSILSGLNIMYLFYRQFLMDRYCPTLTSVQSEPSSPYKSFSCVINWTFGPFVSRPKTLLLPIESITELPANTWSAYVACNHKVFVRTKTCTWVSITHWMASPIHAQHLGNKRLMVPYFVYTLDYVPRSWKDLNNRFKWMLRDRWAS